MTSFKPLLPVALLVLGCCSLPAFANDFPPDAGPCDGLRQIGKTARIYNQSDFDWTVSFKTEAIKSFLPGGSTNAGVVKYVDNGWWRDDGKGDYRNEKTYEVTVPKHQNVAIAYCGTNGSNSLEKLTKIRGSVSFKANDRNYRNGTPEGGVGFKGYHVEATPKFENSGITSYVSYNHNDTTEFEDGSITICPNDSQCIKP